MSDSELARSKLREHPELGQTVGTELEEVHRTDPLVGYMTVGDIECTERLVDSRVAELEE